MSKEFHFFRYGLPNLGNTCFFNAAVQFMRSLKLFYEKLPFGLKAGYKQFLKNGKTADEDKKLAETFVDEFNKALKLMNDNPNTGELKNSLIKAQSALYKLKNWSDYEQCDSSEVIDVLFQLVDAETEKIFHMNVKDTIKCEGTSGRVTYKETKDWSIRATTDENNDSLGELIVRETKPEEIKIDQCDLAMKSFIITDFPEILCVKVMRDTQNGGQRTHYNVRIDTTLEFEYQLRCSLSNEIKKKRKVRYQLRSMISHLGGSAICGHYVCNVYTGNEYLTYDDSWYDAKKMTKEYIDSNSCDLVAYERVSDKTEIIPQKKAM